MRLTDKVRLIAGLDGAVLPGEVIYGGPPVAQQRRCQVAQDARGFLAVPRAQVVAQRALGLAAPS